MLQSLPAGDDIAAELRFRIGQNILALQEYPVARRDATEAIAAIEAELGSRR